MAAAKTHLQIIRRRTKLRIAHNWDAIMFVCNCNGLRSSDIDAAIQQGAVEAEQVYACHGCEPKCRKCVPEVEQRLITAMTEQSHAA